MSLMKKITSVGALTFCTAALTVAAPAAVYAEEETIETVETVDVESQLQETVQSLTDSIIEFSDEEIENYLQSTDTFTVNAMTNWKASKAEVGERVGEETAEDVVIEFEDGVYTAVYSVDFSDADADFIYTFDQTGYPTDMTIDVKIPLSVTLQRAGLNTLMGVGIVFIVLVFLSFLISLFKYIPNPEAKKQAEAAAQKKAQAEAAALKAAEEPAAEELADDTELVAVIMAAIAASEGTSTDGFVVRSIRKRR